MKINAYFHSFYLKYENTANLQNSAALYYVHKEDNFKMTYFHKMLNSTTIVKSK